MVVDKAQAIDLIDRHLHIPGAKDHPSDSPTARKSTRSATARSRREPPSPTHEFSDDGRTLRVLTPFTTRPYDHAMSNALGHLVSVTNRGLHTTASGNSQQNRITPDWPDTVTREVPSEAFYLYDIDTQSNGSRRPITR